MDDWIEAITDLLFTGSFMTLGTADAHGVPWVSPVEFVCDEELRFHWRSASDARHSSNIRVNPRAALAIYDSAQLPGSGHVQGLYVEGNAEEPLPSEVEAFLPGLTRWISWRDAGRVTPRPDRSSLTGDDGPFRLYRLTATGTYALDPRGHPEHGRVVDHRVPVDLADSFARAYRARLN